MCTALFVFNFTTENDAPKRVKYILESRFPKFCDVACGVLADMTVTNIAECTGLDLLVEAACVAAGLGPEDPIGDACAVGMGIAFETACVSAIESAAGEFGEEICKEKIC